MVIGGKRVNLWIWWSIGWNLTAVLMAVRFHFRPLPLVMAVIVGALVPRVLAACDRITLGRRLALAIAIMGALMVNFSLSPSYHHWRFAMIAVSLGGPSLVAGLLLSGFLPRAQPFLRRALAVTIAFSAIVVGLGLAPRTHYRSYVSTRMMLRSMWPIALAALAVVPPLAWRRSPGEQALLAERSEAV